MIAPSEIKQSAGWIAPDGKWFACSGNEHDEIAESLRQQYGIEAVTLEVAGWIRVQTGGALSSRERVSEVLTQKQAETLAKLQDVGDTKWKNNLVRYSRPLGLE